MKSPFLKLRAQRGVALLEALIAVVLLAVGLLGTIGLQARAYSALTDATLRAEATLATEKLIGIMGNDQANVNKYAFAGAGTPDVRLEVWLADLRKQIPGASVVITVAPAKTVSGSAVDMTISWTRKAGEKLNTHHVLTYITTAL